MRRSVPALCLLALLCLDCGPLAAELKAGAAAVDISPTKFPINLPGGFNANMAESAHDPLHSRAMVLSDGETTIAMVLVDNLGVAPEVIEEAKQNASTATGIPVDRMLVCSTHTHSAPSSNTSSYREIILNGITQSIIQAYERLRPASIGFGSQPLPEEVFNRRWFMQPGRMPVNPFGEMDLVKMNPPRGPGNLDRPAGPTDPDIDVISVVNAKRKPVALFANYALHYVGGIPRGQVSADYFGEFARLMAARMNGGPEFVSMISNGASGDINNIPFNVMRPPREPFEQVRIVARKAADTAWFAQREIEHTDDVTLDMRQREVTLTYRRPSKKQVEYAQKVLAATDPDEKKKLPRLADAYAKRVMRLAEREEDTVTVIVQAIRIGDFAVCGLPFETLVEIGLEVKDESPFQNTMFIGLANGRHGYLPPPEQHRLGGYETWLGTNYVQKDASVILTRHLLEMLGELNAAKND